MKLVPIYKAEKIEAVAQKVSDFVEEQFAHINYDSPLSLELEKLPEYKGLTNSEYWLAMVSGLSVAKDKAFAEFLKLQEEADEDDH